MKQYTGLKFDVPDSKHWVLGAQAVPPIINATGDWRPYIFETQQQNYGWETNACVIFTTLHCIELIIYQKYGIKEQYSKRFLAALVDTSIDGTTPQIAAETLRKSGIVHEMDWPFLPTTTQPEFFQKLSQAVLDLAKEFLAKYEFNHWFVPVDPEYIGAALKSSPLLLSVSAWFQDDKGLYYFPEGMQNNHATTLVYLDKGVKETVYDSYADGLGDPFLKDIRWGEESMLAKGFTVNLKEVKKNENQPEIIIESRKPWYGFTVAIIKFLQKIFKWYT